MHIDVRDIIYGPLGTTRSFRLADELPELDGVTLTLPVSGEVMLSSLDPGLAAQGHIDTAIELECHRCLRTFSHPLAIDLYQEYAERPTEDELPIENLAIDLAPAIRQELLLALPIKQLCAEDCAGIAAPSASVKKG